VTDFTVRQASPDDLDAYVEILAAGDATMRRHGNGRWQAEDIAIPRVAAWIASGEAVLALADKAPAAIMLLQWRDLVFWPDRDDATAGYLHKIAVRPDMAGRGATAALVAWAKQQARQRGRRCLRLDTGPWPRLCAAYVRLGFSEVDRIIVNGKPSVRFEQAID
jgi:GNAT superfamily N-acetyltransferase